MYKTDFTDIREGDKVVMIMSSTGSKEEMYRMTVNRITSKFFEVNGTLYNKKDGQPKVRPMFQTRWTRIVHCTEQLNKALVLQSLRRAVTNKTQRIDMESLTESQLVDFWRAIKEYPEKQNN